MYTKTPRLYYFLYISHMNQLHEFLRSEFSWYSRWHEDTHANAVTWGIFLLISILFTSSLINAIYNQFPGPDAGSLVSLVGSSTPNVRGGGADNANVERLRTVNNVALARANEHALAAPGQNKAAKLDVLKQALTDRKNALEALALTDPRSVRRFVFDAQSLESIPEAARALVEKPFKKEGVYHVYLESIFVEGQETVAVEEYYLEVSDTERYRLALTEEEAYSIESDTKTTVTGVEFSNGVVVPTELLDQEGAEPQVLGASTVKNIAVIPFNFRTNTAQPLSVDQINSLVFTGSNSVAAHMRENSFGKWDIQGKVFNWVTIDVDPTGLCDYYGWATKARDAIAASGQSLSGYTNLHYTFPKSSSNCAWGGIANMPGTQSWVLSDYFGYGGNAGISMHEIGHNYGFHHAGTPGAEYGDGYDPMSSSYKPTHYSNFNKAKFWFDPAQITTVSQSGTYTLESIDHTSAGTKMLRVKKAGTTGEYLYLEFRTPEGFDARLAADPVMNSITVRQATDYTQISRTTRLAVVPVGSTYTSSTDGVSFTTVSTSTAGAQVRIDFAAIPCVRANPTVTATPSGQWGSAGGSLSYTLAVKNNDSTGCGTSTFAVTPILPVGFIQSPSLSLNLSPGVQSSVAFSITAPSTATPASYIVTESVKNTASTANTASASVNYNIASPDATVPTVAINSPVNGAKVSGSKVNISASASDASGISNIQIQVDGVAVKNCGAVTSCTYSWSLRKVSAGSHVIKAVAVDASAQKNTSETSIGVTK